MVLHSALDLQMINVTKPLWEQGKMLVFKPPQYDCFWGYTGISMSVCLQNTRFCQSTGGAIYSHLLTALVLLGC